jgi:hypothetical protein
MEFFQGKKGRLKEKFSRLQKNLDFEVSTGCKSEGCGCTWAILKERTNIHEL